MPVLLTLIGRDLHARIRDRSALVLAVLAPLALTTILSFVMAGPDTDQLTVGYVGDAGSPTDQVLRLGHLARLSEDGTLEVKDFDDEAGLRRAIDSGRVESGLVVDGTTVRVLTGPDGVVSGAILTAVARSAGASVDGVGAAVGASRALGDRSLTPAAAAQAVFRQPARLVMGTVSGDRGISPRTQIAAGMATFFLFFTVQFGVLGLLEERRVGTLPRLLAAPVAARQILIAKVAVSFMLGVIAMACLIGFASLVLDASFGSPAGVAVLVVCGVTAAVSTVTLVAGLARTSDQAASAQGMVALVLGILGGSFFSLARAGGLAAQVTRLTPHYWFTEGLVRLSGGADWTEALAPGAAMVVFAAVCGVPGLLLARRAVRP